MSDTTYRNPLDIFTEGRALPDGCDTWAMRTVRADLASSNGFRWPFPGQWADAPGPVIEANTGACPQAVGDGLCVATSYRGMASAGVPARTLLLCAFAASDVLGRDDDAGKLRVRRVFVVDLLDGERVTRANLTGADLAGADLTGADLTGADLTGARLTRANLTGADLTGADLTRAYLAGAYLTGANLTGADLTGANLAGAYLTRADLSRADLTGARYDRWTRWPDGFNPAARGAVLLGGAS